MLKIYRFAHPENTDSGKLSILIKRLGKAAMAERQKIKKELAPENAKTVLTADLDHFWQEFAGKLFATIVASHEKGLTVTDQLRTVARQCYAWSLPYGISFSDRDDLKDGQVSSDSLKKRLEMFAHDIRVYGEVLAKQRRADLSASDPGFMARYRKK